MSKFLTIIAFLSVFTLTLRAQLSSPTSDFKVPTAYSPQDSIFIFHQTPLPTKGSLSATTPENISARFEWSAYDTINKAFLSPFKTENNVSVSTAVNLEQGGYRVRITASGYDTTMTGWVFLDDMTLKLEKNNAGEVLFYRKTCESTNLQANAEA
ncbi:MAG: hypothetical protein HC830_15330, partial [Bacteroidetes bacterium]|nr:hypothetical protein [Bacteroidota bacterium]